MFLLLKNYNMLSAFGASGQRCYVKVKYHWANSNTKKSKKETGHQCQNFVAQ